MKFGEQLGTHLTPEWRKQYIEYNDLKDQLYEAMEASPSTEGEENARYLAKVDEAFFAACEAELAKVNFFFSQKQAEAQGKFYELSHDLELWKAHQQQPTGAAQSARRLFSPLRLVAGSRSKEGRTGHQLKLAFSEYYLSLVLLQNYQQLNGTGFRKILKKRDKLIGNSKGLEWRQNRVEKAPFFLTREIEALISKTENVVINDLEKGDRSGGMKRLRVPPLSEAQNAWTTFRLGLYSGSFLVLLGIILLKAYSDLASAPTPSDHHFDDPDHDDWEGKQPSHSWQREPKWVAVRLFRGFLLLFLYFFLIGLNMWGWQQAGVNHVLIFEINPRQHLTYQAVMETGAFFAMIWALAVLGFLFAPQLHCSPLLFPLLLALFCLLWILNPFPRPRLTYRSSRFWFLRCVARCFTTPAHFVTFSDFWLADQMNSFVTFFLDLEYFVCFYSTEVQYNITSLEINPIPMIRNGTAQGPGIDFATGADACSSNVYGIRPVVSLLPALIRFLQCLRRYRDTRKRVHLANAGKYATSFFVVIIGSLNTLWYHDVTSWQSPLFYPWLAAYLLSFAYTFTWDVRMDWGLAELKSTHPLLREELVYSSVCKYYAAILVDFVLRLGTKSSHPRFVHRARVVIFAGWVLNLSLGDAWTMEAETLLCITAPLECLRRFVWNYFRLENEHLNNCGQFRAVRDISVKPLRLGELEELVAVLDSPDGVTHRGAGPVAQAGLRKRRKRGKGALWRPADPHAHQFTLRGKRWTSPNATLLSIETAPARLSLFPAPTLPHNSPKLPTSSQA